MDMIVFTEQSALLTKIKEVDLFMEEKNLGKTKTLRKYEIYSSSWYDWISGRRQIPRKKQTRYNIERLYSQLLKKIKKS